MDTGAPGIAIAIVRVGVADYHRHLLRLDRASRWSRFAAAVDDRAIDAHCLRLLAAHAALIGIAVDGEVRGAGEIVPHASGFRADAAFSIETPWRGRGFGRALMAGAVDRARELGLNELILDASERNEPMLRMIARHRGVATDGSRVSSYCVRLHGETAARGEDAGISSEMLLQGYV